MNQIFLFFILFLAPAENTEQKVTLSGYLKDGANGEALIGATIYINELNVGVVTNTYGFYSISVPKGVYTVTFSYLGFETQTQKVDLNINQQITLKLGNDTKTIDEVVVTGERKTQNVESIEMSMQKIPVKMVKKLPSFMGEVDIIKSIQLLPGIQSGGEGSSGLYVRGGGADENLMLLDEAPVYSASHLMGFFSVFNSDAIKDIQVYKGGIPAEYGGKASSVIDIRMKDGNTQNFHITGGISNISGRLTLEGPIINDKWSYILSGRRTWADWVGRTIGIKELKGNKLYFYDLNGKTNIQLGNHDRIFISAYGGDDNFALGESIYMRWGNTTATARWNHVFGVRLFSNTSLIYSQYRYNLGIPGNSADQFDWSSSINDYNFKEDLTWFLNPNNKIDMGINVIHHHFEPGKVDANENSYFNDLNLTQYNALENAAYIANEQQIGSLITLKYGLRYSYFQQLGEGKERIYVDPEHPESGQVTDTISYSKGAKIGDAYKNFEPRIAMKVSVNPQSSVKISYCRMVQNLHLITNANSPTPLDIWLPSNSYIKPLIVDQYAIGYYQNFLDNMLETSVEFYYKDMQNVLDFKDGANLFLNESLETEVLSGTGYSYGMEIYVKKQQGNFTGWLSYTLAKTMREIPGINGGKEYASSYDRTHDISLVLSYALTKQWNLAATWVFATGNPTTYPVVKYTNQGNTLFQYSDRNANRLPEYHRLDLSMNYDFKKNDRRRFKQSINVSLYNAYARRNTYSIYYRQDENNPNITNAYRLSIIGSIVPAFTYNVEF